MKSTWGLVIVFLASSSLVYANNADDYRDAALALNPAAYYTFNDITGGIVENLVEGEPNGLTYNSPSTEAVGIFTEEGTSSAIEFTGSNYMQTTIDVSEEELAVSFWFKTTSPNCGLFGVVQGPSSYDRGIYLSNGNIYAYLYSSQTINSSGINFADNSWHQVVYTYGASISGQAVYVDGKLVASGNKTYSDFHWQDAIRIGHNDSGGYTTGSIDEFFIVNSALSQVQVESLYAPFIGTHVLSVSPQGIIDLTAGGIGAIDIEFSEVLNLSTFNTDDVEVSGPGGVISASSISFVSGTTYRVNFPPQNSPGRYVLIISGEQIQDIGGNLLDLNTNAVLGEPSDIFVTALLATNNPSLYNGLAGLWSFDKGQGEEAIDYSGYDNHGQIAGATWTSGVVNGALLFDGNDGVDCGDDISLTMTDQMTLTAWVKPASNHHGVIAGNEGQYLLAMESDGTIVYALNVTSPSWAWRRTECGVSIDTWSHIALSYSSDKQKVRLYKNGILAFESDSSGTIGDYHPEYEKFMIGNRQASADHFNGAIDEVSIFNRALSQSDIHALIAETADCRPDLLYKADLETDYSGNDLYLSSVQITNQQITTNMSAVYDVQLQDDSDSPCPIVVTGSVSNEIWEVDYLDPVSGDSIYAEITTDGKIYYPGNTINNLTVLITPKTAVHGNVFNCTMTASQVQKLVNFDEINLQASFSSEIPVPPFGKVFTSCEDFNQGQTNGVSCEILDDDGHLILSEEATTLPYIWIPNSSDGTISKVNTATGDEIGRYRVGLSSANPSRTTVDLYGNCWVGNRNAGTVVKVGLYENGQYNDRNLNGTIETSRDTNGDGSITGSEILPFGQDECVLLEIVVIPGKEGAFAPGTYTDGYSPGDTVGPRGIAIDRYNNCWVGCHKTLIYYYIDGATGQILNSYDFTGLNHRPYGAVVDENGVLWSAGENTDTVIWLDPVTGDSDLINIGHCSYGMGADGNGHLFIAGWDDRKLTRLDVNTKTIEWTVEGKYQSRGVAITNDGDVWVANSGENSVTRWTNDGQWVADIVVGSYPTGVSVDAEGYIWAVNFTDQMINRIDPATNTIDTSKLIAGNHYGYSDMTGIVSRSATSSVGTWKVMISSGIFESPWGAVNWNSFTPWGTDIDMYIRTSNNRINWSYWEYVDMDTPLRFTPNGKYAEIKASFRSIVADTTPVLYDISVYPSPTCGDVNNLMPSADINKDCQVNLFDLAEMAEQWLIN